MPIVNLQNDYKESIVNIWTKYASLPELNVEGCEYRKSPLAYGKYKKYLLGIKVNPCRILKIKVI